MFHTQSFGCLSPWGDRCEYCSACLYLCACVWFWEYVAFLHTNTCAHVGVLACTVALQTRVLVCWNVKSFQHERAREWLCWQECTVCLSVSFCRWEVGRISGKLKHSPAQQKTALHSCGPWWRHSWLRLWTQSGPTRTARVPRRNRFPATQKKQRKCYIHNKGDG